LGGGMGALPRLWFAAASTLIPPAAQAF